MRGLLTDNDRIIHKVIDDGVWSVWREVVFRGYETISIFYPTQVYWDKDR